MLRREKKENNSMIIILGTITIHMKLMMKIKYMKNINTAVVVLKEKIRIMHIKVNDESEEETEDTTKKELISNVKNILCSHPDQQPESKNEIEQCAVHNDAEHVITANLGFDFIKHFKSFSRFIKANNLT